MTYAIWNYFKVLQDQFDFSNIFIFSRILFCRPPKPSTSKGIHQPPSAASSNVVPVLLIPASAAPSTSSSRIETPSTVKRRRPSEGDEDEEGSLYIATEEEELEEDRAKGSSSSSLLLGAESSTLDYLINSDGSCTCKLCGERVASRTHWYRHKYKVSEEKYFLCLKNGMFCSIVISRQRK